MKQGHLGILGNRHLRFTHACLLLGVRQWLHLPHFGALQATQFLQGIRLEYPLWALASVMYPHLQTIFLFWIDLIFSASLAPVNFWLIVERNSSNVGGAISYLLLSGISITDKATLNSFRLCSVLCFSKRELEKSPKTSGPMYFHEPDPSSNCSITLSPFNMAAIFCNLLDWSNVP